MKIKFRKDVMFDSTDFSELNTFIENSTYDKLKNIKFITTFPKNILESSEEITIIKFLKLLPKFKYNVPNNIQYWLERGWSEEDANLKIIEFKENQKKGIYEKITPEKRKEYALNANKKRIDQIRELQQKDEYNKTNPTRIEFYLAKGLTQEEAEEALKQRQATFSKKSLIEKHGEEVALKILAERNKKWFASLKENNDWDELSKNKGITLEKLIRKHGEVEGTEKYYAWKDATANTYENFIIRHGQEIGDKKWLEHKNILANRVNTKYYSNEACDFFAPLLQKLNAENILVYTISENCDKEYFILDGDKICFYDFTIPSLKLIIEYHGTHVHPNPSWGKEKWNSWKHAFTKMSADQARSFDERKKSLAESQGFRVLEIWNDADKNENFKSASNFIFGNITQT